MGSGPGWGAKIPHVDPPCHTVQEEKKESNLQSCLIQTAKHKKEKDRQTKKKKNPNITLKILIKIVIDENKRSKAIKNLYKTNKKQVTKWQ